MRSTEFNENVLMDEFQVSLADGTKLMLLMILDDASSFRVVVPTTGVHSITGEETRQLYEKHWLSWAGPPECLYYDAHKAHLTEEFAERAGDQVGTRLRPVPAESPQLKGRVERAIDFFKDLFSRVNHELQLSKTDDPWRWTSSINYSMNNHLRRNGFTPYQYVLGKSPRAPTSLTADLDAGLENLSAHSAALYDAGARRAEQIRAAANRAFFELDSDEGVRRAMVGRNRPSRNNFEVGQLVFYWRSAGTRVKSKRIQGGLGWRGPAMVLAKEGHTRLHLSYRGVPILVTPEQCRHLSLEEAETVEAGRSHQGLGQVAWRFPSARKDSSMSAVRVRTPTRILRHSQLDDNDDDNNRPTEMCRWMDQLLRRRQLAIQDQQLQLVDHLPSRRIPSTMLRIALRPHPLHLRLSRPRRRRLVRKLPVDSRRRCSSDLTTTRRPRR